MNFDTKTTRFFEMEGKCFAAGNRTFSLAEPDPKGNNSSLIPFGVKQSSFNSSSSIPIVLDLSQVEQLQKIEDELKEKMEKCPEFLYGTKKFYSFIKTLNEYQCINAKLTEKTNISYFDTKKCAFTKGKLEQILPGQKVYVDLTLNHPWKLDIEGALSWGFSFRIDDIIILSGNEQENTITQKRKSSKDLLTTKLKKKTKMMNFKQQEE